LRIASEFSVTSTPALRGRFAPSPTGPLHLGSLVAALASYLFAKSQHGQWLIRVEDLDPPREVAGMAAQQIAMLAGFGLHSDEPIIYQSNGTARYEAALARLLEAGKAFYCSCSRTQLQPHQGLHRACVVEPDPARAAIRLRVPDGCRIAFTDGICGDQSEDVGNSAGDFVLKRADGFYAYQLAVVVDDDWQGITEVVRGADLLDSTARQIFLQRQLGFSTPRYRHVALVLDAEGRKLSKSQWAKALDTEDRFLALHAAYRHLGQDAAVLSRQLNMAENLAQAVRHFKPEAVPAPSVRAQP
jgi:glutamyl-Q tRNA(Asp) synthetase